MAGKRQVKGGDGSGEPAGKYREGGAIACAASCTRLNISAV